MGGGQFLDFVAGDTTVMRETTYSTWGSPHWENPWRAYMRGGLYTWNNTSVKEKVGLFAGGLYAEKYGIVLKIWGH